MHWSCRNASVMLIHLPVASAASNMLRLAAFADDVAGFDAAAFRLARAEAVALDPQARTLLQQVASARQVCGSRHVLQRTVF